MKHVTKIACWLVGAVFALACGGTDEGYEETVVLELGGAELLGTGAEAEPEAEEEIGTADFALTLPDGYGLEGTNSGRCSGSWSGGCLVPKSRTQKLKMIIAAPSTDAIAQGAVGGRANLVTSLNSRGWTVTDTTGGDSTITVSTESFPGTAFLQTAYTTNSLDESAGTGGTVRKYSKCVVKVDTGDTEAHLAASAALCNATCKQKAYQNLFGQALGLCAGLGKTNEANVIMGQAANQMNGAQTHAYTATERNFWRDYRP